ncbi:MAG: radical SAM protein [Bacteroidota bacterium]
MSSVGSVIDKLTVKGEIYESLPDGSVRCFACGHRCLIHPGKRGICQVRFNEGGELRVPWGYVAALQSDPIEKKPFFHVLPGTNALTFGMLGCDFHCGYCFPGETMVITGQGPRTLEECFGTSARVDPQPDAEIGYPEGLQAVTASGAVKTVRAVFKHPYEGELITVRPYYLPELRCTPEHRVYAALDAASDPELIPAEQLTEQHYLAIPRRHSFMGLQAIDVQAVLAGHQVEYRTPWKLQPTELREIVDQTAAGRTSRDIGFSLGKDPSYIRHIRGKAQREQISGSRMGGPLVEAGALRFPNEHRPGIPVSIELNDETARLLGLYCAEGSVVSSKDRPNSLVLNFSFSPREGPYVEEVQDLLCRYFGVNARRVQRDTTLAVAVTKSSLGLLFKSLAGGRASEKRVPAAFFESPLPVVRAFLDGVVDGDGHRFPNGKISLTTVSREFAYGIAWLVLKSGYLPSLYETPMSREGKVQGRSVRRSPYQYSVVWYEGDTVDRHAIQTAEHYLVPLRDIRREQFSGAVYNMEVEEEHSYLAGFLAVSNCQNWLTSQAMRDPASDESVSFIRKITPQGMVQAARRTGASAVVSSYNEPLITSEWAVGIFKEAKAAGLKCAYVSNGNNTPQVMEYIRPYIDAYKVDLKCMQDKNYRKLGGVLQNTLDGIQRAHNMGLWVEIVTLTIPGFNDSNEELWDAARFIAGVSRDIPWHVTAFHKDYKMTDHDNTDAHTLLRAAEIGREAGLHFVYAGNLPGHVEEYEDTLCPNCNARLVERQGYVITGYHITKEGTCPKCGTRIPGVWPDDPSQVQLNGFGFPLPVY